PGMTRACFPVLVVCERSLIVHIMGLRAGDELAECTAQRNPVARRIPASLRRRAFLVEARRVGRDTRSQSAANRRSRSGADRQRLLFPAAARSCCDALICTDVTGVVTSWNESATLIFGYSASEMIGADFSRIVPEDCHLRETEILTSLSSGSSRRYECMRL